MSDELEVVIVGAGFAGLYMLHRLRGLGFRAQVVEAASDVGGTWYWNRYPGARCDIESMQYSYQFSDELQQSWEWTERYASQPEILRYANHVADRFDLRRDIRFDTQVKAATFDDAAGRWTLETDSGAPLRARFCVMATGCLSAPNTPELEGLVEFGGPVFHTGRWPHRQVDFTGQRVAVIGTGSSAIQSIPLIARQATQLFVFQRTANYSVPAQNAPLDPDVVRAIKADYAGLRARAKQSPVGIAARYNLQPALEVSAEEREREYETRWREGGLPFMAAYTDLTFDRDANETAAAFVRAKIRGLVRDPATAEALSPEGIIGAKRLCVDTGYYETFNRPNVTLIDLAGDPVERIEPDRVRAKGWAYKVDSIVLATGFDAMTGALLRVDIRGRRGASLRDAWQEGPRTYLGLAMAGFPNLFTITGPGSPSVLTNMLPTIEQHVDWIADCLAHLRTDGRTRIEASAAAQDAWGVHCDEVAARSLRPTVRSWYTGANIDGKPRAFMPYVGGFPPYVQKCDQIAAAGYEGFLLT